ncbi:MAG: carbohydrate ABC transporter permease [Clostridia bacterium]|nr:carbohydrate ABC transporter permease [Clostridia bacterium]
MKKFKIKKMRALNRSYGGDVGINVFLLIVGAFMALPFVYAICSALKPLDELWYFPPRFFVENPTLKNFTELFRLMSTSWVPFSRYIFNTVFISVVGTGGHVLVASLAAYALSKMKFPGRNFMFKAVEYSLMYNAVAAGIAIFIILSALGWIDTYLAIIIPTLAGSLGLFLMKQFMDSNVPDQILEAAHIDGAGEFRIWWQIAMPLVKPAWLTLIILMFQSLWQTGASIYIQSEELKTFSYAISQVLAGGIVRTGAASASTVIMMSVPILVFVLSQSNVIETMATSGMKD